MEKQRGGSINHSGSYANGLQDLPNMAAKSSVDADDIIDKYKEALMYYTKYKNAGVVEMEASFKACRVLIEQKKFLQAADFLQNVVYINLQLSDEDRISRYSTLSSLYEQIGFRRKSSFFRRVAAMQCVAPQNPKQDWHQCHELLVKTLSGYQIHVSDSTVKAGMTDGWPVVQIRVLHEMIYSARRMSNLPLAIRYTTLLLHGLLDHLSSQEKRDLASSLETFTSQCEGTPQLLELESGLKIPPVHLYRIPLVRMFKLMPLHPHLEPRNWKQTSDTSDNVFIFTPLNIGTVDNEKVKTDVDFCWVQGDISEVQLRVVNPMPDEVKVGHLTLLTEGVEVEPFPTSPALPSGSGPYLVKLMLRPTTSGDLSIMGYSTKLFGVKSNCKLRDCPLIQESHFKVKVVPALPTIQLSSSLPKSASFLSFGEEFNVVTSGTVVLYTGQSCECVVTLQNSGKHPVEKVRASLEASRDSKDCVDEVFRWSEDNINSQLPLQTNSMLCFTLALNGVSDFLLPRDVLKSSTASASKNISVEGKSVEAILKLEYSGGPGLSEGYCRCCSIAFTVEVNPSLVFHSWDVMPSESCDHCYLLFDVQNVSGLELQVQYSNQSVYLQPGQIRRLCLQIERCQPQVQCEDKSLEQTFSQYLATFVDIRWTIPSQSVSGRVSIDQLTWTEEQQSLVHTSPVSWEVKLNGQLLSPLHIGSLEYRVGEMIHLDIELNFKPDCEDVEGQAGALSICCCQYCDNGNILYNTGNQVFPLGTQSLAVPKVSTDDPIHHSCTYMFLCSGLYRFEVTMKVKGECQGSRSPQPRAEEMPEVKVQTWKCSSVIEVNIED